MDPQLKALLFLSPVKKVELRAAIEAEAAAVSECVEDSQETPARPPPEKRAIKESTNYMKCMMTLYSLQNMSSQSLHISRMHMQK